MTEVTIANCSCFTNQELFFKGMEVVSHDRQKKVNQAKSLQGKIQRLGAGVLLNHVLKKQNLSERDMEYSVDSFGKPVFSNCSDLHFNLSHSGDWVICALSDRQVGADVQVISEYQKRIAERCFSQQDVAYLMKLSGEVQNREFTRLWARKEARVKYFGTWKGEDPSPPVVDYLKLDEVRISVCTYDTPIFRYIKDISNGLF